MRIEAYAKLEGSELKGLKICPISQLVEISSPFAGVNVDELMDNPNFCSFEREEPEFFFDDRLSKGFRPRDTTLNQCEVNFNIINGRIRLVEEVLSLEAPLTFNEIYKLEIPEEDRLKLFSELGVIREKTSKAERILSEWREALYDLIGCEEGDEDNHHFSGYKYEELSNQVVLDEVKKFNEALRREMLGHNQEESCSSDFYGFGAICRFLSERNGNK